MKPAPLAASASPGSPLPWKRPTWWALLLLVLLAHLGLGEHLAAMNLGDATPPPPPPIEVAFVRELALAAPPVAAKPVAPPAVAAVAAKPAASAASAPALPASAPEAGASQAEQATQAANAASAASAAGLAAAASSAPDTSAASVASSASAAASGAVVAQINVAAPAQAASAAPLVAAPVAFDWPPSTRLEYDLEGYFRGPIYGNASVEWRRQGEHYQVKITVAESPMFERRMISDGTLGPSGLMPRRFDQETQALLSSTRRDTVLFTPDAITLANGRSAQAPLGVQDSASQFVQMTWLFLTHPERMQVGAVVQFPLALPHRVSTWTYDVTEQTTLSLPFGLVNAFHLKPRLAGNKPNELSVEMWMAPALQYLPVRIFIQQNTEIHLELSLKKPPLQAASTGR